MLINHFPLLGLRLTTPRLELRLPSGEDLGALADLAAQGIHDPGVMPFSEPWTDQPAAKVALSVIQYHWQRLGSLRPDNWSLGFAVLHDGDVVGLQCLGARDFATLREVHTGSWLGRRYQGVGIGTEMRAAVLHLAFLGLGAQEAISAAMEDNAASLAIATKLGYQPDGVQRCAPGGRLWIERRLRLTRSAWARHQTIRVEVKGLGPCLPFLKARPQSACDSTV